MKKHLLSALALVALLALAACVPAVTPPPAATLVPTEAATLAPAPATIEVVAITPDARPTVPAPPADGSRPLAAVPAEERNERFSGPAAAYAKPNTIYIATIVTDKGNIVAELYQDTPASLNNFLTLALNGFFDGLTFHRVVPEFVIQGGDPAGTGQGGPGYTIPAEIRHPHIKGALAWARTSDEVNPERASSGSQFYITLADTSFLDDGYSVFGNVIEGLDITEQIETGDMITRVEISTGTASLLPTPGPTRTPPPTPTPGPTNTPTVTPTPYAPTAQDGRPLAALSLAERERLYNMPPEMTLDTTKTYQATIETEKGNIVLDLDPQIAPLTVNNFVTLATLGYYDGMPIAYNDPSSWLVSGSPAKEPDSDIGYTLALEENAVASDIVTGTLSAWTLADPVTGGPAASGSQFLIWQIIVPDNPGYFNSFGKVIEGLEVVGQLTDADLITRITISSK